jgi:hypothetical protein
MDASGALSLDAGGIRGRTSSGSSGGALANLAPRPWRPRPRPYSPCPRPPRLWLVGAMSLCRQSRKPQHIPRVHLALPASFLCLVLALRFAIGIVLGDIATAPAPACAQDDVALP